MCPPPDTITAAAPSTKPDVAVALNSRLGVVLLGLLACNTAYYLVAGRLSEALESVAWYALLILFTLESGRQQYSTQTLVLMRGVRGVRAVAALAIAVTAVLYVREQAWLDAINLFLWIAVVVLLETEVRLPALIAAHRKAFTLTAVSLYTALGVIVAVWLARGQWMNAWDAALWLTAFGLLELRLLSHSRI
jgi:hypothetical protein